MRAKSWRQDLDKQATINAYLKAKQDGAHELASRIRLANPDEEKEFNAIDYSVSLIPVIEP